MKEYLKKFVAQEDGAELVEYSIVVAVVALLAGAVFAVVSAVKAQIENAANQIQGLDPNNASVNSGGGGEGGQVVEGGDH